MSRFGSSARRIVRVCSASLLLGLAIFGPSSLTAASAETPAEVIAATGGNSGIYVGSQRNDEFDPSVWQPAIDEAARHGYAMIVLAPNESIPDDRAFALRVRQAAEADITLLFGEDGNIVGDVVADLDGDVYRALDDARSAATPGAAADAYVSALTTEFERETPAIVGQVTTVIFLLLLALGATIFAELGIKQWRRTRHEPDVA